MDTELTQLISSFDMMKEKDPNSLACNLADFLGSSGSHDFDFRKMCAVLLHKLLTDDNGYIWKNDLTVPTQSTIRCILLTHINLEESKPIMEELCRTVSKLCNLMSVPSNDWPELLPFLHECVTSDSDRLKESFFLIFAWLDKDICQTLIPDITILHTVLLNTLNDDGLDLLVRISALGAAINFILCLSSLNEMKRCQNLLPGMLRTLADASSNGNREVAMQYALDCFIQLAKNEPRFFRILLVDAVNTVFEIAEAMDLQEKTRNMAVWFLLTLVEAREKAPGMMKKLPLFTYKCFALLSDLLLDIKDEPSWYNAENCLDEAGDTDNFYIGGVCLTRFSNALGGKTVAPIAVEHLNANLVSEEWERRHAALTALLYIAKGCSKVMIKYLDQVVDMVLHSFQDPHPRVRWAAIRSIAHLSIVFTPHLQEKHHDQVVPALASAMDDFQNPPVQAIAAVAVLNFCVSENPETLVPYLDGILTKLLVLIKNDNQMVQEKAIYALGGLANLSKEHFRNYYVIVMPCLKTFLVNTKDKANHMLQSKALECMIMVGMTVGRKKFGDDVNQVMEVLKLLQESQVEAFGTTIHILKTWLKICECMGKDFLPYMSAVMPLLVNCAQLEPDNIIDELDKSNYKVKFGGELIYTTTSDLLEVKALACCVLGSYALILGEDFYPWISQATSILVPLLKFHIHNDVREYACGALYSMLNSAKLTVKKGTAQVGNYSYFKQLAYNIILALGDALFSEPDTEVCGTILHSLSACLQISGPLLNEDHVHGIIDVIKHVIIESSRRREELKGREKLEDFDAEEDDLLREEREKEEKVSRCVGQILFTLIKASKVDFLPFLDELSSYLMPARGKHKTAGERLMYVIFFVGLLEKYGEAALKYQNLYLPFLLEASNDEDLSVRQSAVYGLGLCAEYVSIFRSFVGEALLRINVVITHLHAHEPENEGAYDNAVSALGKICQFHRESIDSAKIIPTWLNCLPIKGDVDEAKDVHDQLCSMIKRSDGEVLGPKYEHFPKIMSVFAEVLCAGKNLATEETTCHMIDVLRDLQKTIPPATWVSAWSLLLPQQEMELESVLSSEEDASFSSMQ